MIISTIDSEYSWSKEDFEIDIEAINSFNKSLRKFYNFYKKLEIIHSGCLEGNSDYEAYIVGINGIKIELWIPSLEITHKINIISPKLLMAGDLAYSAGENCTRVNDKEYSLYQRVHVSITPRPGECVFNRKLHISI